jgi:hypothetical protein
MATSTVNATWQMCDKLQSPVLNEYSKNLLYTCTTAERIYYTQAPLQKVIHSMKLCTNDCKDDESVLGLCFSSMPKLPTYALLYEGCLKASRLHE